MARHSTITLPDPSSFTHWAAVFRGFQLRHNLGNPIYHQVSVWLSQAERAEAAGWSREAEVFLEAALMREAYDRDTYYPPLEYQEKYGS